MSALFRLAERCEQASGPDRELDRDIAAATAYGKEWMRATPEATRVFAIHFTNSIDAAMKLKPDGLGIYLRYSLKHEEKLSAEVQLTRIISQVLGPNAHYSAEQVFTEGYAATPALALCAASLRARASEVPSHDD
jgi:hypothetical protein